MKLENPYKEYQKRWRLEHKGSIENYIRKQRLARQSARQLKTVQEELSNKFLMSKIRKEMDRAVLNNTFGVLKYMISQKL